MPTFHHDRLNFNYVDMGEGQPFIFQHGLGGDLNVPVSLFKPQPGVRFIALDCRGHGETRPLGDVEKLNFNQFADDVLALVDHLHLPPVVIGGVSMGAGLSLNFALRYPERVRGLVFSRPAWLDSPMPSNLRWLALAGTFIQEFGSQPGLERFKQTPEYAALLAESSDAAATLVGQFLHPRADETAAKLVRLSNDAPSRDRSTWAAIRVPTLVLVNQADPVHPVEFGQTLAEAIPGAELKELTSKAISNERYIEDTQDVLGEFMQQFIGR